MKRITAILLSLILLLQVSGCSKPEDELYAFYSDDDNLISSDIGEYIEGRSASFLTEGSLCYVKPEEMSDDENLKNKATLVINITKNELVYAKDCFKQVYPASITKLLTTLVILENGKLDEYYTVKQDNCGITEEGAQLMGFKAGDVIKVEDLLYCLLLYSGNDAAAALADYLCQSETDFCRLMNEMAISLGCIGTHYTNPHGLHDSDHYTTAYDEYVILKKCLEYDIFRKISELTEYDFSYKTGEGGFRNLTVKTTNKYKLGIYEVPEGVTIIAGKTGNTYAAGPCLIQCVRNKDNEEFIIAIFGAKDNKDLYTQMTYLMNKVSGDL